MNSPSREVVEWSNRGCAAFQMEGLPSARWTLWLPREVIFIQIPLIYLFISLFSRFHWRVWHWKSLVGQEFRFSIFTIWLLEGFNSTTMRGLFGQKINKCIWKAVLFLTAFQLYFWLPVLWSDSCCWLTDFAFPLLYFKDTLLLLSQVIWILGT